MNTNKIKLTLGLLCGVLLFPFSSEAASKAVMITEDTALFTIEFAFEDDSFGLEVPIAASSQVSYNDRTNIAGFTIEADNDETVTATALNGIVLSDAIVANNRYQVTAGEAQKFTMVILATFAEPLSEGEYRARITKLPYYLGEKRTSVHENQLEDIARPILEVE